MHQTAPSMYPEVFSRGEAESNETNKEPGHGDIEADIQNEIEDLRKPDQTNLVFHPVKLDVNCGKKPVIT